VILLVLVMLLSVHHVLLVNHVTLVTVQVLMNAPKEVSVQQMDSVTSIPSLTLTSALPPTFLINQNQSYAHNLHSARPILPHPQSADMVNIIPLQSKAEMNAIHVIKVHPELPKLDDVTMGNTLKTASQVNIAQTLHRLVLIVLLEHSVHVMISMILLNVQNVLMVHTVSTLVELQSLVNVKLDTSVLPVTPPSVLFSNDHKTVLMNNSWLVQIALDTGAPLVITVLKVIQVFQHHVQLVLTT